MKTAMIFLMFLALLLPNTLAQDYTQWGLPEGAITRLGKGSAEEILYSPDGARLAVVSTIGIWIYDTTSYQAVCPARRGYKYGGQAERSALTG